MNQESSSDRRNSAPVVSPHTGLGYGNSARDSVNVAIFQEFIRQVRGDGAIPYIVYLPEQEHLAQFREFGRHTTEDAARKPLAEARVKYFDLTPTLASALPVRSAGEHYSRAENRVVALYLSKLLRHDLNDKSLTHDGLTRPMALAH